MINKGARWEAAWKDDLRPHPEVWSWDTDTDKPHKCRARQQHTGQRWAHGRRWSLQGVPLMVLIILGSAWTWKGSILPLETVNHWKNKTSQRIEDSCTTNSPMYSYTDTCTVSIEIVIANSMWVNVRSRLDLCTCQVTQLRLQHLFLWTVLLKAVC